MVRARVLAIGLDPAFAGEVQGYPPEVVRGYLDAQLEAVRAAGMEVESCLIDGAAEAEAMVAAALAGQAFDCVVIGAGLRVPAERVVLFEAVVNLVHAQAPRAWICFNTSPADTLAAVRRWVDA